MNVVGHCGIEGEAIAGGWRARGVVNYLRR